MIYGIPQQMHTDNGSPFGSVKSLHRFSRLSYWLIDLGIMPVFSESAHLEQNGALRWDSKFWVYLTVSLKGKYVGLKHKGNGIWEVYYRNVFLGFVDEKSRKENETSIKVYQKIV
jgi:hypothetical protein